ncbi:helix-turn-helix domain-containing protein [Patescibacteria group bacterium]|nr:helix-turn-helix domain-containing protein [Patescibacteria group bacterium]
MGQNKEGIWKRSTISGEQIAKFREKTGLTQQELALLLHCTVFTVCKWETGKHRPQGYNVFQIRNLMKEFQEGKDIANDLRERLLSI